MQSRLEVLRAGAVLVTPAERDRALKRFTRMRVRVELCCVDCDVLRCIVLCGTFLTPRLCLYPPSPHTYTHTHIHTYTQHKDLWRKRRGLCSEVLGQLAEGVGEKLSTLRVRVRQPARPAATSLLYSLHHIYTHAYTQEQIGIETDEQAVVSYEDGERIAAPALRAAKRVKV